MTNKINLLLVVLLTAQLFQLSALTLNHLSPTSAPPNQHAQKDQDASSFHL